MTSYWRISTSDNRGTSDIAIAASTEVITLDDIVPCGAWIRVTKSALLAICNGYLLLYFVFNKEVWINLDVPCCYWKTTTRHCYREDCIWERSSFTKLVVLCANRLWQWQIVFHRQIKICNMRNWICIRNSCVLGWNMHVSLLFVRWLFCHLVLLLASLICLPRSIHCYVIYSVT